ncbi:hypothetical protein ABZX90_02050 [Streptomyces sp. NPDC002935]|uniref:ComEC/Rec2 family competence protein n=1 Tax=unclassified Streptomyces TaxID=2593676 RepID=UPI00332970CE
MIRVEALPARHGDCLWVEWDDGPHLRRMLIDGGPGGPRELPAGLAARFDLQPEDQREFELVVCTHIDDDHLAGLVPLLTAPPRNFSARDIWFNALEHTGSADTLGVVGAQRLTDCLRDGRFPWNAATRGRPVVVPAEEAPPRFPLRGLRLTLLSPWPDQLTALRAHWQRAAAARTAHDRADRDVLGAGDPFAGADARTLAQLAAHPYHADDKAPNGSSIAFLAEHPDGSRVLFGADAHADVLVRSVHRIWHGNGFPVSLVKAPHHGSAHNTSSELTAALGCGNWLISTNGGHGHEARSRAGLSTHPAPETVARIMVRNAAAGPPGEPSEPHTTLWFNHRSPSTERYAAPALRDLGLRTEYPDDDTKGITVVVSRGRVFRGGTTPRP